MTERTFTAHARAPVHQSVPQTVKRDRLADWLVYAPIVLTTIFGKFSIPPMGAQGLGLGYPLILIFFTMGAVAGRVGIDTRRAAYFTIMIGVFGMEHALRQEPFSALSLIFMTVVSLLFTLSIPRSQAGPEDAMRFVANWCTFIAICGIIQFFGQFAVGRSAAFPIETYAPQGFLIAGFHYLNPLYYGATVLKSNGIFMLEPSFFSQLMAIGLIVEMTIRKRILNIAILTLAITVSYSGTGLLILVISLPVLLVVERRLDLLAVIIGVGVLALAFAIPLRLDLFLHRLSEFGQPDSSAFLRFIGWIYLASDTMSSDPWRTLFGYGAGSFKAIQHMAPYTVAEMLHSKVLVEYGLLGFLAYVGFLMYCIFTSPMPLAVRVAVAVLQFMAGAFAEPVTGITMSLLLLTPRPGIPGIQPARAIKGARAAAVSGT